MDQLQAEMTFRLENFEGPLDFLWYLIQKNEIDIYEIHLHQITRQFLEKLKDLSNLNLDASAEFLGTAACLVWMKSKHLLPKHEQEQLIQEDETEDPRFEIIHSLIDYSRFKEAGKGLAERELQQNAFYSRGAAMSETQKNLGIEHLSLEDLAFLFKNVLAKAETQKGQLHEEIWKVSDKIEAIRKQLMRDKRLLFGILFTPDRSRSELIVLFLAILELMKTGEVRIIRELSTQQVMIMGV